MESVAQHILFTEQAQVVLRKNFRVPESPNLEMTKRLSQNHSLSLPGDLIDIVTRAQPAKEAKKRQRVRRHDSGPLVGNNRHGRTGKLRCDRCRIWKQKCNYPTPEKPCEFCVSKNLPCGPKMLATSWKLQRIEEAKIRAQSNSILRLMPTPDNELLPPFERSLIHPMPNREFLFGLGNFRLSPSNGPKHRLWDCVLRRYGRNLSSTPVRYGCLLYALFKNGHAKFKDQLHLSFLDQYYVAMQKAISLEAYADLVYGCYAGCMYVLRTTQNISEVLQHLNGYRLSAYGLVSTSSLTEPELVLIECMWEKMLWYMAQELLFQNRVTTEQWGSMMDALCVPEGKFGLLS